MLKQKGEASKMKPGGSNESYQTHVSNPQRAAWEDGHSLNESYKVPGAHQAGRTMNHSYMHPLVNPSKANSPAMAGRDKTVESEKELKTKPANNMGGKVVFSPQLGKNPA